MKRILLFTGIILSFWSCSIDDDNSQNISFEILAVEGHDLPLEFRTGETYTITVQFTKPDSCHQFNDFLFSSNVNERTIAVITSVDNSLICTAVPVEDEASFNFFVNGFFDHYVFKFWQGKDNNGNDIFTIVEVPVVE